MELNKWHSYTKSWKEKDLVWYITHFPELSEARYIVTEKIHGSNFQIAADENNLYYFSRNQRTNINFQGGERTVWSQDKYLKFLRFVETQGRIYGNIRVYGEIFGPSIFNNVPYKWGYRVFGIKLNETLLSASSTIEFLNTHNFGWIYVPVLAKNLSLQEALDFDIAITSSIQLTGESEKLVEGIVIIPQYEVFETDPGHYFTVKKKNKWAFEENRSKKRKEKIDLLEISEAARESLTYLNEQRMLSAFSKLGIIEKKNQMGNYIREIQRDVLIDLLEDHPEFSDEVRTIRKVVGSEAAIMLVNFLRRKNG